MSRQASRPKRHPSSRVRTNRRTLHAIDIDNLLGGPLSTDRREIERVLALFRHAAEYNSGDLVVMATGCNGRHVLETELAWAHVGHRRRSGPDGADHALIEELMWAADSGRVDRVVIGSGDHIFEPVVRRLIAAEVMVTVVATRRALSHQLRAAVGPNVRLLGERWVA